MSRFWTRLFTSLTLLAIGMLIGVFYTERQYQRASETPLLAESYVRQSACPSETLNRVDEVLAEDGIAVPPKARQHLRTKRETLIAEICPPGRRGTAAQR